MNKVLYIGSSKNPEGIRELFKNYDITLVYWEEGIKTKEYILDRIEQILNTVNFDDIECIFSEGLETVPLLFKIRKKIYVPIILAVRVNPYPINYFLKTLLFSTISNKCDLILAGSSSTAKIYSDIFKFNAVPYHPFGINTNIYHSRDKKHSKEKFNLEKFNKIILYTGRLDPDKNIGGLLAISKKLKENYSDVNLVIAYNFYDNDYFQLLNKKFIEQDVKLLRLDQNEMPYIYSAADLFITCATSFFETFGRSPLESMACGTPVVVPNWLGFNEYIKDKKYLIDANFFNEPLYDWMDYAMVNLEMFYNRCVDFLEGKYSNDIHKISYEAEYINQFSKIKNSVYEIINNFDKKDIFNENTLPMHNPFILELYNELDINSVEDLFNACICENQKWVSEDYQKKLFYHLFKDKVNI